MSKNTSTAKEGCITINGYDADMLLESLRLGVKRLRIKAKIQQDEDGILAKIGSSGFRILPKKCYVEEVWGIDYSSEYVGFEIWQFWPTITGATDEKMVSGGCGWVAALRIVLHELFSWQRPHPVDLVIRSLTPSI